MISRVTHGLVLKAHQQIIGVRLAENIAAPMDNVVEDPEFFIHV